MDLMIDFHTLTGIRIVLFDSDYRELISYPDYNCAFCTLMKANEETSRLCDESDRESFLRCQNKGRITAYHCHAGLIEATAPLIDHNSIIGYMMFGQTSDKETVEELCELLSEAPVLSGYSRDEVMALTDDIPLKSKSQLKAAAKIMEACTLYAIMRNTISIRRDKFMRKMDAFLDEHLADDLSTATLCRAMGMSKTKLYQDWNLCYGRSINEHIRYLRVERAKKMLAETDMSVTDVSSAVGFSDYNYFCRVFKKDAGISARKYRLEHHQ